MTEAKSTPTTATAVRGGPWITERVVNFGVVAGALAGSLMLWWFEPGDTSFFPRCSTFQLTGMHCPGCGAQRAIHHLLNGRFLLALHYNPLVVLTAPWIFISGLFWTLRIWDLPGRDLGQRFYYRSPGKLAMAFAIGVILFGVLRNVPGEPFSWLAPPERPEVRAPK